MEGLRAIPQCPNTEDRQEHPIYTHIPPEEEYTCDEIIGEGWRRKGYWILWYADPAAQAVTHVDPWGDFIEQSPGSWMGEEARNLNMSIELSLHRKGDGAQTIECSECKSLFVIDQDLNLTPVESGDTFWEVL